MSVMEFGPTSSLMPVKESGCRDASGPESTQSNSMQRSLEVVLPNPKLRLQFEDLTHDGSRVFLKYIPDPHAVFTRALSDIVAYLYTPPRCKPVDGGIPVVFEPSLPSTVSVTLILRSFSGVAYTVGLSADSNHKEIHFSLNYIAGTTKLADPAAELIGVITHELVHCYQHTTPENSTGIPQPPSGLIEGVADFVRLKAGLVPPHWKRPLSSADLPESWDSGYQRTAFFFEWLEDVKVGTGAIGMLNDRLLREGYVGEASTHEDDYDKRRGRKHRESSKIQGFWVGLFGVDVLDLWQEYGKYLDRSIFQ
ncbi:hypothetical protein VTO42DRAFT_8445 [Malbranchea cinnamomea]